MDPAVVVGWYRSDIILRAHAASLNANRARQIKYLFIFVYDYFTEEECVFQGLSRWSDVPGRVAVVDSIHT